MTENSLKLMVLRRGWLKTRFMGLLWINVFLDQAGHAGQYYNNNNNNIITDHGRTKVDGRQGQIIPDLILWIHFLWFLNFNTASSIASLGRDIQGFILLPIMKTLPMRVANSWPVASMKALVAMTYLHGTWFAWNRTLVVWPDQQRIQPLLVAVMIHRSPRAASGSQV